MRFVLLRGRSRFALTIVSVCLYVSWSFKPSPPIHASHSPWKYDPRSPRLRLRFLFILHFARGFIRLPPNISFGLPVSNRHFSNTSRSTWKLFLVRRLLSSALVEQKTRWKRKPFIGCFLLKNAILLRSEKPVDSVSRAHVPGRKDS